MQTINGHLNKEIFSNDKISIFTIKITDSDLTGFKPGDTIKVKSPKITFNEGIEVICKGLLEETNYGPQINSKSIEIQKGFVNLNGLSKLTIFKKDYAEQAQKVLSGLSYEELSNQDKVDASINEHVTNGFAKRSIRTSISKLVEFVEASKILFYGRNDARKVRVLNNIYDKYGTLVNYVSNHNPYTLSRIDGVTFKQIDNILSYSQIQANSALRAKSFIEYAATTEQQKGHTCIPKDKFISMTMKQLDIDEEYATRILEYYVKNNYLHADKDGSGINVYVTKDSKELSEALARNIARISKSKGSINVPNGYFKTNDNLNEGQNLAVNTCVRNKFSILTGGPGTGKTTTLNTAIERLLELKPNAIVKLCAPTGKAALRMTESTGKDASTIHRLLGKGTGNDFKYNTNNKLDADIIVIDESSMMGEHLTNAFLEAIPSHAHVIFIGDHEQLPSVEGGNVLRDLIESNAVPVAKLTQVMRQVSQDGRQSEIITVSKDIIKQNPVDLNSLKKNEVVWINSGSTDTDKEQRGRNAADKIEKAVARLIETGVAPEEIQVLSPRKGTTTGVDELNERLRVYFNPEYKECEYKIARYGKEFYYNDRVIFTKNNYDLGVSNGDMGTISYIDLNTYTIKINLARSEENDFIELKASDLDILDLAFAKTVHKSQGSEYEYVVMPVMEEHQGMLYPEAIYTAMTRAKKKFVMVGEQVAFNNAMANSNNFIRHTSLQSSLKKSLSPKNENSHGLKAMSV